MRKFKDVNELVNILKQTTPYIGNRPRVDKKIHKIFKDNFPGKVLYAVKPILMKKL